MERDRLERRACLLFSWREKAQALADGRRLPREQDLPKAMDARRAADYFLDQLRRARRETDKFRARLRERMENAQDLVRVALHQQKQLGGRVAGGRLGAKEANDENRRLQEEIRERGNEANVCHHLIALETAEDLGGFIDLPLPRYAQELQRFAAPPDSSDPEPGGGRSNAPEDGAHPVKTAGWKGRLRGRLPQRLGRWDAVAVAAAVVAVLLAGLYVFYSTQISGSVSFDMLPAPQGTWVLSVDNKTGHAITVAVPGDAGQGTTRPDYAVFVEMRGTGQTDFRRLPGVEKAWVYGGGAGSGNGPVAVAAHMNARWTLSPGLLSVPEPDALLRVVVMSGGRQVCVRELAFETRP